MKTLAALVALTCISVIHVSAQPLMAPPRLVGFINQPERKCVLLDFGGTRPGLSGVTVLMEGQRKEIADVEVLRLNADRGTAEVRVAQTNFALSILDESSAPSARTNAIVLTNAALPSVLDLYADYSGRTVLRHPLLPNCVVHVRAAPANQAEAAMVLEMALAAEGVATLLDGKKFALLVPEARARRISPLSSEIKQPAPDARDRETIPAGAIVFSGLDVRQATQHYAGLAGRKINLADWPHNIPGPFLYFRNQTALTKPELLYAFDTLFEWNGLKLVPDGDKFLKLVHVTPK